MDTLEIKLCDIQGRLFELSVAKKMSSAAFAEAFMRSRVAANLDDKYNRMQWAGEEYLMDEIQEECLDKLAKNGKVYTTEEMYWMGYLYRYWHFLTGESSLQIFRQASVITMRQNYLMFHTLDPELAVENLQEIHRQKLVNRKKRSAGKQ